MIGTVYLRNFCFHASQKESIIIIIQLFNFCKKKMKEGEFWLPSFVFLENAVSENLFYVFWRTVSSAMFDRISS